MGKIVKAIGAGVGLVAEAVHTANQPKKSKDGPLIHVPDERADELIAKGQAVPVDKTLSRSRSPSEGSVYSDDSRGGPSDMSEVENADEDERMWALDEAAEEVSPTSSRGDVPNKKYGYDVQPTVKSLEDMVMARLPPIPPSASERIPQPIILPQRRPGNMMGRGFVRAYPPILEQKGIPEDAWIAFLKSMTHTNKVNPVLGAVFVGAAFAGFAPEFFVGLAAMAVQVAVGAAIVQQKRSRARTYLDDMNDKLFKPRGLYAMVMAFNPTQKRPLETGELNMESLVAKRDGEKPRKLFPKIVAGQAFGEMELPDSAPLVFPTLDKVHNPDSNKFKKGLNFVHDYNDRRAQVEYARKNPDSRLAMSEEQTPGFSSRLADPNHPAFQGSWITLFSGGKIKPLKNPEKKERRKAAKRRAQGKAPSKKTVMKENVVYLMVVNMPTEEELEEARRLMESEAMEEAQKEGLERQEAATMAREGAGMSPAFDDDDDVDGVPPPHYDDLPPADKVRSRQ